MDVKGDCKMFVRVCEDGDKSGDVGFSRHNGTVNVRWCRSIAAEIVAISRMIARGDMSLKVGFYVTQNERKRSCLTRVGRYNAGA